MIVHVIASIEAQVGLEVEATSVKEAIQIVKSAGMENHPAIKGAKTLSFLIKETDESHQGKIRSTHCVCSNDGRFQGNGGSKVFFGFGRKR